MKFVQQGMGDVLIAWENEALLAIKQLGAEKVQIVVPTVSILAEPPVAVVDRVVLRKGSREVATAYLQYLYSKDGQEIIGVITIGRVIRKFWRSTRVSIRS